MLVPVEDGGRLAAVPRAGGTSIRAVFLRDCAICHGADARGTKHGPSLQGVGAAGVDYWVSTGRMPISSSNATPKRSTPRYSRAEIDALVAYVARLTGGPPIPRVDTARADIAEGGIQFRLNCAACHAWSGTGGALLHREAPPLRPATPTQIAEAIRLGPGNMPAFGAAALTDHQVSDVVGYVENLDHPHDPGGSPLWHLGPLAEGAIAWLAGMGLLLLGVRAIGTRA